MVISSDDDAIASFTIETNRLILTYDDDFVEEFAAGTVNGVLYLPDTSLRSHEIAAIVDDISRHYPQHDVREVVNAGRNWL